MIGRPSAPTLGYNTPAVNAQRSAEGPEDGHPLIGGSMIADPNGKIVAEASTDEDELIVHPCDLDACRFGKQTIFDFARHRRIEHYGRSTEQTGVVEPAQHD